MRKAVVGVALVAIVACGGGGGGSTSTPTSPSPIPSVDTCNSLGGTSSKAGQTILNGSSCAPERSSIVLVNLRNSDNQAMGACSGTVIAPRVVLTAAHCLDEGVATVRIWVGVGVEAVAASFTAFPNYRFNTPGSFDVGVVFMGEDVPRNPVPILTSRDARVGEAAIIAGWGRDQSNVTATLHAGSTTISRVNGDLLESVFAPPSSSVCSGDSGGPILLAEGGVWSVAGITSATSDNICNTGTNFYQAVRATSVRDFILQHVAGAIQR